MAGNTTNAIGYRFWIGGISQRSKVRLDSKEIGFAATPSANRQEVVLSPASESTLPTDITEAEFNVRSVFFLRTSGKVKITVDDGTTTYTQIVTAIFSMSPAAPVTIKIETAETHNTNALVIWS